MSSILCSDQGLKKNLGGIFQPLYSTIHFMAQGGEIHRSESVPPSELRGLKHVFHLGKPPFGRRFLEILVHRVLYSDLSGETWRNRSLRVLKDVKGHPLTRWEWLFMVLHMLCKNVQFSSILCGQELLQVGICDSHPSNVRNKKTLLVWHAACRHQTMGAGCASVASYLILQSVHSETLHTACGRSL